MIENNIVFYDFETGSADPYKCQPTQLAAVIIDLRRIEIIENSTFNSYIRPLSDEDAVALSLDPLEDAALSTSKVDIEVLKNAPPLTIVFSTFVDYLKTYAIKGGPINNVWDMPIRSGYNNIGFDDIIMNRLCREHGFLTGRNQMKIFHPVFNWDLLQLLNQWFFFHNLTHHRTQSSSFDQAREYFGFKKEGAHDASIDVIQGATLLCKFLKLHKSIVGGEIDLPLGTKLAFKNCIKGKI